MTVNGTVVGSVPTQCWEVQLYCDTPEEETPADKPITAAECQTRFTHVAKKCALVLGLNNQERQWVRDAGHECEDE